MKCKWDTNKLHIASGINIEDLEKNAIVELSNVHVNNNIPPQDRLMEFLNNINNPYILKSGNILVKLEYQENGRLLDSLVNILSRHIDD